MEEELERITARIISIDCICRSSTRAEPLFATIDYIDDRTKEHRFALFTISDWELKVEISKISAVKETLQKALIKNSPIDLVLARRKGKDEKRPTAKYDYVIKVGNLEAYTI